MVPPWWGTEEMLFVQSDTEPLLLQPGGFEGFRVFAVADELD
jgi:hypothetical protein